MNLHNNTTKLAFLALLSASVIWGATIPIMKLTLIHVPVFTLAFLRFGIASLLIFPFVKNKLKVSANDAVPIVLSALTAVTLNITFFFWAVKLTTALNVGIIGATVPILTLLAAHVFLRENITKNLFVGAAMGILGIGVIITKDFALHGLTLSPLGDFFMLLAVLAFVASEIINKKLFVAYSPLVITFYAMCIGAITFFPAAVVENMQNPVWIYQVPFIAIFGILYGICFSSLAAYFFWHFGLSKINASQVGFFYYLDPLVATTVSVFLLSEKITPPFLIGALFIFLGIFFAESHFSSRTKHHIKPHLR